MLNKYFILFFKSSIPILYSALILTMFSWLMSSIFVGKSILFKTIILVLFLINSNKYLSSSVNCSLLFRISIIRSLFSITSLLLFTPICSTISFVSLIPAVSIRWIGMLSIWIVPSTISLVVPAILVTIALFSSKSVFSKLLFPTFGLPIRHTFIPSVIIFPFSLWVIISSRLLFTSFRI